jgi:uncharacterized membrane protein YbhN (UPF0104 family)
VPLAYIKRLSWRSVVALGILVASVVFLWRFPWSHTIGTLRRARVGMLALALAAKTVAILLRAERMQAMMHRELRVGRWALLRYLLCAFAADNLVASTAGVAVRGLLLHKQGGVRGRLVIGALAFEKYLDGAFMGAGLWVAVHWHLLPFPFSERAFDLAYLVGFLLMVAALGCARLLPGTRAGRLLGPAGAALGSPLDMLHTLLTSAGVWAAEIAVLLLTLRSLGLPLGLAQVAALATIGTLAFVLPGIPSGAGTFEASLMFGLSSMGVEGGLGLSAALLYHAVQVLPATLAGLACLRGGGMTLGELRRATLPDSEAVVPTVADGLS